METRNITEYKVYVLTLADMHGGVDKARPVAVFDSLDKLKSYYQSQLADAPYSDKGYNSYAGHDDYSYQKVFKKGSPLEWYNPADSTDDKTEYNDICFGGVFHQWVDNLSFNIPYNPQ